MRIVDDGSEVFLWWWDDIERLNLREKKGKELIEIDVMEKKIIGWDEGM